MDRGNAVTVYAEGGNHARLLEALRKQEISVFDFLRQEGRKFAFSVQKKDLQKTFAILQDMCYTYTVERYTRTANVALRGVRRLGLLLGVLAFALLAAFARGYVWRIRIVGNDIVPDKVIESTLAAHNISIGKRLGDFDSDALSTAVRNIDGISLASVYKTGTTITVEVFEGDPVAPPMQFVNHDIVSLYDATVTRIVTRSGTTLAEQGQNVFAGTPLIGAYRQTEEGVDPTPTQASGIVYGTVAFTYSQTVATEWYEYEPKNVSHRTRLTLFGLTIGKKLPTGAGYSVQEDVHKLDVFVPVTVRHARITEMQRVKRSADIQTLAAQAEEKCVSEFIGNTVSSGFTHSHTVRELGGGTYLVNVFIQAEIIISDTR